MSQQSELSYLKSQRVVVIPTAAVIFSRKFMIRYREWTPLGASDSQRKITVAMKRVF